MQIYQNIDLSGSINSGQVFLWERFDNCWYGVDGQNLIRVTEEPFEASSSSGTLSDIFRESDDIPKILKAISKDKTVKKAVKNFPGLRLMRQDPFQCYISFIVSANSSIQNIRTMLKHLCKRFGEPTQFDGREFFLFPKPAQLANASLEELQVCGLGYRAKFVKEASKKVNEGIIDFDCLQKLDYQMAKNYLLEVWGIGNKVADCILLFSLNKLDSFPLDRWMLRVLKKYYRSVFEIKDNLTEKRYDDLHTEVVKYFGPYAGYSQQFLFKMERELNNKKW